MTRPSPKTSSTPTVGPLASRLITGLHQQGHVVFRLRDVMSITGLGPALASAFMAKLTKRGLATRLKSGLFVLVPFEFGDTRSYVGNPYAVARELAEARDYYISHASAMDIHQMATQPSLVVYVTTTRKVRNQTIHGTEFRMIRVKPSALFGTMEHWIDKQEHVTVSDLERTIVDGLKDPNYCGGLSEVAKAFWIRRNEIRAERLVDYSLRLGVGSVIRRTGYLLELWRSDAASEIARLRGHLTNTYVLLDPGLPASGRFKRRWRLRLNVSEAELTNAIKT